MKFTLIFSDRGSTKQRFEDYDYPHIKDLADAEAWGRKTLDAFNSSLRPHEKPRAFIRCALHGKSDVHDWTKTSLVTQHTAQGTFDRMQCTACKITGKRFGLGGGVTIDSKYRKYKLKPCLGTPVVLKEKE